MQKAIVILLLITNIVVIYSYYKWGRVEDPTPYQIVIDSLNKDNDSLIIKNKLLNDRIDSLYEEINKTDSIIVEIDKWYEKNLDDVISLPDSGQLQFFTDYLSKNRSRLSSSNN